MPIVNLRNCKQNETVFAFEINSQTGDLTPCRGRKLDIGCYVIEIDLLKKSNFNFFWLTLLIIPLSFVGFYVKNKFRKKEEKKSIVNNNDYIQLGSFRFYTDNNVLKSENSNITLTEKETRALKIFAENINQIVEREKLMKVIWEDEGIVVISRNVDVLVSKLRKKLSDDNPLNLLTYMAGVTNLLLSSYPSRIRSSVKQIGMLINTLLIVMSYLFQIHMISFQPVLGRKRLIACVQRKSM